MTDLHELAIAVSRCPEVSVAWDDKSHPCHQVVSCQRDTGLAHFQRPEPWMGGLATARVLFIASNPSISDDPSDMREAYPSMTTSDQDAAEFFVRRFDPEHEPVFATFNHPSEPNFLTLSLDGQYRNGVKRPKSPQPTWSAIHNRAVELLGADIHPYRDWALTEIVHCKSRNEIGVVKAAPRCRRLWLDSIVAASPAPVVVALGNFGRDFFARELAECPTALGSSSGYKDMTQRERVLRDTFVTTVGGRARVVVFNFRNGSSHKQSLPDVYGHRFVAQLRSIALGSDPVPPTSSELHALP
jgi:uracil-DNA glycosylase